MFVLLLCLLGTDPQLGWLVEKISWEKEIPMGTAIELVNEYGDVRARGTDESKLALSAMIQKQQGDAHQVRFDIREEGDKVLLKVVYDGPDEETIKGKGKRRGDVTIFVPKGASFKARTTAGLLEVKGLGDVDLETHSGRVYCRVSGHVRVKTHQGDVRAVLKDSKWEEPPVFESSLGTLEVQLPPSASLNVEAVTRGEITTDYSLTIEEAKPGLKRARIKIGEGGQTLHLTNSTGAIKILKGRWDAP